MVCGYVPGSAGEVNNEFVTVRGLLKGSEIYANMQDAYASDENGFTTDIMYTGMYTVSKFYVSHLRS